MSGVSSRWIVVCTIMVLATAWLPGLAWAEQEFWLQPLSSRPDAVSGGDVLVQMSAPDHWTWTAQLNGRDVTSAFRLADESGNLLALLSGLKLGRNTVEIRSNGTVRSKLEIADHPLAGPIFSGPHQQPFICQTVANGLGPAADADCSAASVVQYYYKSTEPVQDPAPPGALSLGFKIYDPSGPQPSDVARVEISDGHSVPYIVRREIGTINRAVYDIQFLHQPGHPLPTPWSQPTPGWNGRLVYLFRGGCSSGYRQGTLDVFEKPIGHSQADSLLAQGYAVATSTLNIFGNNCNDRIAAETLSMVKEHFIKTYGVPVHTIGVGESGGAMQQYLIAQNYPGLLDGIIPFHSFPDVVTSNQTAFDCSLLDHTFNTAQQRWHDEQKTAVAGFATWRTCFGEPRSSPQNCDPSIPKELIYDRTRNPKGARCDIYDNEINIFGRDPRTGHAYRPLDNVGVQYGLLAFDSGKIDAEQFIELNALVGGYDEDDNLVPERTAADPEAIRIAYRRGVVLTGAGLSQIPIIDWRFYMDDLVGGHDLFRSFVARARLVAADGNADNQVIHIEWRPELGNTDLALAGLRRGLVRQMDRWLDNIAADHASVPPSVKVARNRPADLADGCLATDGEHIVEPQTYDGPGRCNQMYPAHGDPRIAAGGPLTDDVLKCALKPINAADYPHPLTADQLQRLKAIFPNGVCDYSRPSVGRTALEGAWLSY